MVILDIRCNDIAFSYYFILILVTPLPIPFLFLKIYANNLWDVPVAKGQFNTVIP